MTLPIYRETRAAVPCEWLYDDDLDDEFDDTEPSRWDALADHAVVAITLASFSLTFGAILFLAGWPA